jgi:hypothetical protein
MPQDQELAARFGVSEAAFPWIVIDTSMIHDTPAVIANKVRGLKVPSLRTK